VRNNFSRRQRDACSAEGLRTEHEDRGLLRADTRRRSKSGPARAIGARHGALFQGAAEPAVLLARWERLNRMEDSEILGNGFDVRESSFGSRSSVPHLTVPGSRVTATIHGISWSSESSHNPATSSEFRRSAGVSP
jgi:hypothetical protein